MKPSFPQAAGPRDRECGFRRWRAALVATRVTVCVAVLVVAGGSEAHAQVSALGKGFLLDAAGSLTSDPNEVISGRTSIKGSPFLERSDHIVIG